MTDESSLNQAQAPEPTDFESAAPAETPPPAQSPPDELASAKAQADEYLNGWKRAMADYANLQKEVGRFKEEFSQFACAGLIQEFLPVLDNFQKATLAEPSPEADTVALRQWAAGLQQIEQQFESVMKKIGVEPIAADGAPFDPAIHDALLTQKKDGVSPGQVIQVVTPGYRLNGKVIRPARVIVSE